MKITIEKTIKYSGIEFMVSAEVAQDPSNDKTWTVEEMEVFIDDHEVYDVLGLSVIDYLESEIKEAAKLEAEL